MSSTSPLIVLVDDDASVRRALRRLIAAAGFAVDVFASGQELLGSDAVHRASCIVLDVHLGRENGFDVQQRLVALGIKAPVVFMTGDETPTILERARLAGAVACLRKPLADTDLLRTLRSVLAAT
jgi:FixJ family two-component response regulator